MEDFREPVELTAPELDAVAGGISRTVGPMTVNINVDTTVGPIVAANGVANGVADGVGNIVWGNAVIGVGDGGHNGGVTIFG
jgi:hypothetical protein